MWFFESRELCRKVGMYVKTPGRPGYTKCAIVRLSYTVVTFLSSKLFHTLCYCINTLIRTFLESENFAKEVSCLHYISIATYTALALCSTSCTPPIYCLGVTYTSKTSHSLWVEAVFTNKWFKYCVVGKHPYSFEGIQWKLQMVSNCVNYMSRKDAWCVNLPWKFH